MNTKQAQPVIVGSLGATVALAWLGAVSEDAGASRQGRIVAGGFVAGIALLALSQPAPEVAAGLAALVGITMLISSTDLLSKVTNSLQGKAPR